MPLRHALQPWLALALLISLVAANELCFGLIGRDYFAWYARSGVLIGVLTAVFSTAWGDMDKNTLLISANPMTYLRGCLLIVSLPLQSLGSQVESTGDLLTGKVPGRRPGPGMILDAALVLPLLLVLFGMLLVWLFVIAPIQYFIFIFAGALPRLLLESPRRIIVFGDASSYKTALISQDAPVPDEWWDASLSRRPVALTAAFSSLLLLGVKALLNA